MKKGDRVVVMTSPTRARRYGTITGESKDGLCWLVLLDGNSHTRYIAKDKAELLKPEQLAFHFGRK